MLLDRFFQSSRRGRSSAFVGQAACFSEAVETSCFVASRAACNFAQASRCDASRSSNEAFSDSAAASSAFTEGRFSSLDALLRLRRF